jgi:TctA family transporter
VGKGTLALFYTRPIAAVLIACCVALIALQVGRAVMTRRDDPA